MESNLNLLGWEIWYIGGARYRSDETLWSALPKQNVLYVKLYWADGAYRILCHSDWYCHCGENFFDIDDLISSNGDYLEDINLRYPGCEIIGGMWTTDEEYERIGREVREARFGA
jgi:hypothetical protein